MLEDGEKEDGMVEVDMLDDVMPSIPSSPSLPLLLKEPTPVSSSPPSPSLTLPLSLPQVIAL